MSEVKKTREIKYDALRILAAILVVVIHVSADRWYVTPANGTEWAVMNVYDCFARSAVPLFFMLSGAFMLQKTVGIKNLYLKKILPLALIYLVWSTLYAVDAFGIAGLSEISLTEFFIRVINGHYHLWFLPVLIGLYVLQPVLFALVHFENGKYTRYILACFLCFGVLLPTAAELFGNYALAELITGKITVELTSYSGYMILGYYLKNQKNIKIKPLLALLLFLLTVATSAAVARFDALRQNAPSDILYGNFSLNVLIEAVLLFLCFQNLEFPQNGVGKLCVNLASLTFGVYLIHPFVLTRLDLLFGLNTLSFSPFLSIPAITLAVAAISFLISFVMCNIPFVSKFWKL